MNNHPGYPNLLFSSYGYQRQTSSNGPPRLRDHDVQELSRHERLGPYQNSFRKETLGYRDLSSLESRQTFSSEDMNSYRPGSRQYRHPRDDIFSSGRLSQIDQRTLLQSAPRTSFLNDSPSHLYSGVNKLDSKVHSFSPLNQNQAMSKFKSESYPQVSRNMFSKEGAPYDNLSSSSALSSMKKFERDFPYQSEQTFSESRSHFSNNSTLYSKNASFNNSRNFSEEHSPDAGLSQDSLSSGMSYLKNHDLNQENIEKQVQDIQRVLAEQRRLRENERTSLPFDPESDRTNNFQSTSNSFSSQILPQPMNWYQNTMTRKEPSEAINDPERSYFESPRTSDNMFQNELSIPSQDSVTKIHDNKVLNFRESEQLNDSLESPNICATPENVTMAQDSSQELNSDFTDRRLTETIPTTNIGEGTSGIPVTSKNNAIPLKVDQDVNSFDKFSTKEMNCKNFSYDNENLLSNSKLSTTNIETNIPLFEESFNNNSPYNQLKSSNHSTISENLPSNEWTGFKSSADLLNSKLELKNYQLTPDKPVFTNELQSSENSYLENSVAKNHETNSERSLIPDEKLSSNEWPPSVPISLEENLSKCMEIMKNYTPILSTNDGMKSDSLSAEKDSNKHPGVTRKISPKPAEDISSNDSSMSAPIPFLNEAIDPESSNSNLNATNDLSQQDSLSFDGFNSAMTRSREVSVNGSALEHALATLEVNSPIIGLDYIVEEKKSLSSEGRFPFKCKLCNSSIARSLILNHIQGSKHRLRYLKIKDESIYDRIMRQKDQHCDKDILICEAAAEMEQKYGRGRVVVTLESSFKGVKKLPAMNIDKVCHDLVDVDFESTHKPDLKDLAADSDAKNKAEEQVTSTLLGSVKKVEDNSSMDIIMSSASYSEQNCNDEKKNVKNIDILDDARKAGKPYESFKFHKPSDSKSESPVYAQKLTDPLSRSSLIEKYSSDSKCQGGPLYALKQDGQLSSSPSTERYPSKSLVFKRSPSPYDEAPIKRQYVENPDRNTSDDSSHHGNADPLPDEDSATAQTGKSDMFNPLILEQLSKCDISSEDEAGFILQTVDVLLKLLLQYKLKDHSKIDTENLMQSFHNKRPEEIFKVLGSLKENLSSASAIKEEIPEDASSRSDNPNKSTLASENMAVKRQIDGQNDSQNNRTASNIQTLEPSKTLAESSLSHLLQPPPFFCWPTTGNAHGHSSTTVQQTAPNDMNWSSAYQSNAAYYQQQGYTVPHMYQPYGIPLVPSASMPLVVAPLPPASSGVCVPLPPPLPPPPPPNELPPLPK